MDLYKKIDKCRLCNTHLSSNTVALNLGNQYIIDFVTNKDYGNKAPLEVLLCPNCYLAQLKHEVSREYMYNNYWYRSGISQTMRDALRDIVESATAHKPLKALDVVLDIGANDGTLLRNYGTAITTIGFEPATNLIADALVGGNLIVNDYFSLESWNSYGITKGLSKPKIITSIACFYDVSNPLKFAQDIHELLEEGGIWINQLNIISSIFPDNAFEFCSHEHILYLNILTMSTICRMANLEVFHIKLLPLNGGTARFYIGHKGQHTILESVERLSKEEELGHYNSLEVWKDLEQRVKAVGKQLKDFITDSSRDGFTTAVYGASTRGNTLLQYYDLDHQLLPYAIDRDSNKHGKYMVGTKIPIISEEEGIVRNPDFLLVLPYSYITEIADRLHNTLQYNGVLIKPLPRLELLYPKRTK